METRKPYQSMTDAEKQAWLVEYRQWLVDFPKIESQKSVSASMREVFERGLSLLSSFNYCRSFINESLRTKDYHRRLKLIRRFSDRVTGDIQKMINQTVDLTDPSLLIPHVGRPTKEEAAAKAIARQKEQEEKEKAPHLFNTPSDSSDVPDENEISSAKNIMPIASDNRMPAIAQIRWMLSPQLQAITDTICGLRSRFEEACTRAKQMAEDGRSSNEIAPYTQESVVLKDKITEIYAKVDRELQAAYVRLKEDTTYIAKMSVMSNLSDKDLRAFLRPYWDKLSTEDKEAFKASVIEQIKANDPEQAAIRKEAEEKKARIDQIIKYLQRKDKPNTLKRIQGIEKRLIELRELIGSDADYYTPILNAAREDYEKNIRPQEDAAKLQSEKETNNEADNA